MPAQYTGFAKVWAEIPGIESGPTGPMLIATALVAYLGPQRWHPSWSEQPPLTRITFIGLNADRPHYVVVVGTPEQIASHLAGETLPGCGEYGCDQETLNHLRPGLTEFDA